jgi:hypothetical protein
MNELLFILRYSQIVHSNMVASVTKFMQLTNIKDPDVLQKLVYAEGGLSLDKYSTEDLNNIKTNGIIYLYKIGQLTDEEFLRKMNEKLNSTLDMDTFKACWNAMCEIKEENLLFINRLQTLQDKYSFDIHVISNTNKMHVDYIASQLNRHNIKLNMSHSYSFEANQFDPEPSEEMINKRVVMDIRNVEVKHIEEKILEVLNNLGLTKADLEEQTPPSPKKLKLTI